MVSRKCDKIMKENKTRNSKSSVFVTIQLKIAYLVISTKCWRRIDAVAKVFFSFLQRYKVEIGE